MLLASKFLHLTNYHSQADLPIITYVLSSPWAPLGAIHLFTVGGLGVKPFRVESVDYYKCVPTFLHGPKAYERIMT